MISIREFSNNDIVPFFDAVRESIHHVSPWLPWCGIDYSIHDAENWVIGSIFEWKQGTNFRFVIYHDTTYQFLGSVAINDIDYFNRTATLGYWVRSDALRKGIATEASKLALSYAFNTIQLEQIFIDVLPDNIASIKVAHHFASNGDTPQQVTVPFYDHNLSAYRYIVDKHSFITSFSCINK